MKISTDLTTTPTHGAPRIGLYRNNEVCEASVHQCEVRRKAYSIDRPRMCILSLWQSSLQLMRGSCANTNRRLIMLLGYLLGGRGELEMASLLWS
jgi:hypothetical protein